MLFKLFRNLKNTVFGAVLPAVLSSEAQHLKYLGF